MKYIGQMQEEAGEGEGGVGGGGVGTWVQQLGWAIERQKRGV
jgi:hypothetical protein